ncbi:MAG: HD family phosphohydrolase [Anaerolineae bacterium]
MGKAGRQEPSEKEHALHPARVALRGLLLAALVLAAWIGILALDGSSSQLAVTEGEPSPRDVKAPHNVTYVSDVKTRQAQDEAAELVEDVYVGPDSQVVEAQLARLDQIIAFITALRHDEFQEPSDKLALLSQVPELALTGPDLEQILTVSEDSWLRIASESRRILETVLGDQIRPSELPQAKQRIARLATQSLGEDARRASVLLAQSLVVANTFSDPEMTEANRQAAREAVEPVIWSLRAGEVILREGEIVTPFAIEQLRVLSLLEQRPTLEDQLTIVLFVLMLIVALGFYTARTQPLVIQRAKRELLLVVLLVGVAVAARVVVPAKGIAPYLFPAATASMLVVLFLDLQLAMVVSAVVAALVGFVASRSFEVTIYVMVGSIIGALSLWRLDQLGSFLRAMAYLALANSMLVLAFELPYGASEPIRLLTPIAAAVTNALLSTSLAFVAFAFVGRAFGITTSLQLLDLARPTHPLFRQLLIKAPGTYHHLLIVSNMAERAAEAIGADPLLVRVGSYYHDIGKLNRPYFFSENQFEGDNPHDTLDPHTSADIIIGHVIEGIALADKYGLPERIKDFVREHHGTTLVNYFYRVAANASEDGNVDEDRFRYPGPRPQSRETAIVMLADGIEASVRAQRPADNDAIERVIRQIINDRLVAGQLDECDLTLKDLDRIRQAFAEVIQSVFHPRIQYPDRTRRRSPQRAAPEEVQRDAS